MNTLILITAHDELALDYFIEEYNRSECIVIATEAGAHKRAKEAGLPSQLVTSVLAESPRERDKCFADLAMNGVFGDTKFLGTELDIADVLSIDRLSFWYGGVNAGNVADMTLALDWQRLVTVLDIHHPLPLLLAQYARESIAVCSDWSRELSDIELNFDKIITTEETRPFLEKIFDGTIEARKGKAIGQIDFQRRAGLRSGLGISESEKITGVVYDKEFDYAARYSVQNHPGNFVFFTEDERSKELLPRCIPGAVRYDINMAPICDEFIAFGYKPYLRKYGDRVRVIDILGASAI